MASIRHDALVRLLSSCISRSGGAAQVEPRYLDTKRPDIHAFFPDDRVLIDLTVVHPAAPSSRASQPLLAAKRREREKVSHYAALTAAEGCRFLPFVLETLGAFGPQASSFLRDLSSYATESFLGCELPPARLLAVLLQKGNAEILAKGCLLSRSSVS